MHWFNTDYIKLQIQAIQIYIYIYITVGTIHKIQSKSVLKSMLDKIYFNRSIVLM